MLLRPLSLADAPVQPSQSQLAVRRERAHRQFGGEAHRAPIVLFGHLDIGGVATRGDLAKKTEGERFVTAFATLPGESQRPLPTGPRVVEPVAEHERLTVVDQSHGAVRTQPHGLHVRQARLEQGQPLADTARERVRAPQQPRHDRREARDVPSTRQRETAFEQADGFAEFAPDPRQVSEAPRAEDQRPRMLQRLADSETFTATYDAP